MRLAQAGCMTTPSDVPRSQTEIGTKYVAANSLIYLLWLVQPGPLPPPPLFFIIRREAEESEAANPWAGDTPKNLHIP